MERKAFPRGGGVEGDDGAEKKGPKNSHWLPAQKKKKHVKKPKADDDSDPEIEYEMEKRLQEETEENIVIQDLDYKTIQPKMKLLVRVAEIDNKAVHVHLPGSLLGIIPMNSFTEIIGQDVVKEKGIPELTNLVKVNQLLITQVTAVLKGGKDQRKETPVLSLNPAAIYEGRAHSEVAHVGCVLQAVVRSIEDHGYVLDCGIPSLHVFLNKRECVKYCDKWNDGKPLVKGQVVRGVVIKARPTDVTSLVELSLEPHKVSKAENTPSTSVDNISQLLPGMHFTLDVSKKLSNGIGVSFEDMEGFVVDTNIPFSSRGADVGKSYLGCLLYVSKPLNVPMFSLLPSVVDSTAKPARALAHGDIVKNALVESVTYRGVHLLLCKKRGIKGFIPQYVKKLAEKESNATDMHQMGKKVSCRVLSFHTLTEVYLCTTQKSLLEESVFSMSDVPVGTKVTATVKSVSGNGVDVVVGAIAGFIPWFHTADVPLKGLLEKFHAGMKIKGRVLQHSGRKLIITVKESLVKKKHPILKSYDQVKENDVYYGTLVGFVNDRYKVSFFGNVVGYIPANKTKKDFRKDRNNNFGCVIKCSVTSKENEIVLLSLVDESSEELQVGLACNLIVSGINVAEEILHVFWGTYVRGVLPSYQLHDDRELASALFHTYSIGSVVKNARCYNNGSNPVFSTRGSVRRFFESDIGQAVAKDGSSALQPGNVFPCFVKVVPKPEDTLIVLSTPLADSTFRHRIGHEYLQTKNLKVGDFVPLAVKDVKKKVYDGRLSAVWSNEVQTSADYLADIIEGNGFLEAEAAKTGSALSTFSVGQTVSGPVESAESGYTVLMPNGVKGRLNTSCADKPLTTGKTVKGKVLYVDYLRSELILNVQKDILKQFAKDGPIDIEEGAVLSGRIVRGFSDYFLAVVRIDDTLRRAFVPKHVYPCLGAPKLMKKTLIGEQTQFTVARKFDNGLLVCVPKACVKKLRLKLKEPTDESKNTGISELSESEEEPENEDDEPENAEDDEPENAEDDEPENAEDEEPENAEDESVGSEESDNESSNIEQSGKTAVEENIGKKRKKRRKHSSSENVEDQIGGKKVKLVQKGKEVKSNSVRTNQGITKAKDNQESKSAEHADKGENTERKRKKRRRSRKHSGGEIDENTVSQEKPLHKDNRDSPKQKKNERASETEEDSRNKASDEAVPTASGPSPKKSKSNNIVIPNDATESKLSTSKFRREGKGTTLKQNRLRQKLGVKKTLQKKKATFEKVDLPKKLKNKEILPTIVESVLGSGGKSPLVRCSANTKLLLKKNIREKRNGLGFGGVHKKLLAKSLKKPLSS